MNNILFFLTPKAMCAFLYDDYTMRQALEKMESAGYAALPILNKRGEYRGTLTEGDLMWGLTNMCYMDMRQAEAHRIMEIARRKAATMEGIEVEEFTDPRAVQLFAEQRIAEGYLNCAEAVANTYGKLRAMLDTPMEDTILDAE